MVVVLLLDGGVPTIVYVYVVPSVVKVDVQFGTVFALRNPNGAEPSVVKCGWSPAGCVVPFPAAASPAMVRTTTPTSAATNARLISLVPPRCPTGRPLRPDPVEYMKSAM